MAGGALVGATGPPHVGIGLKTKWQLGRQELGLGNMAPNWGLVGVATPGKAGWLAMAATHDCICAVDWVSGGSCFEKKICTIVFNCTKDNVFSTE